MLRPWRQLLAGAEAPATGAEAPLAAAAGKKAAAAAKGMSEYDKSITEAHKAFSAGGDLAARVQHAEHQPEQGADQQVEGDVGLEPVVGHAGALDHGDLARAGDVMHLEDVAPCRGHISQNLAPGATFLQFVQD